MFVSVVINWLNQFKVMGQIVGYHGGIYLGATKEEPCPLKGGLSD